MALTTRRALDLLGTVGGRLLAPEATNIDGQVVPWIFGRQWVKPIPLLVHHVTGAYGTNEWAPWATTGPSAIYFDRGGGVNLNLTDTVDVIWGLGQAGLTIRAVKIDGKVVGIKKNSAGSWVAAGQDTDLEWAIVQAFGSFVSHRVSESPSSLWDLSYAPIEVLTGTGAGSVWGRKITAATVRSSTQALPPTPKPTWSNLTGASYPAWAHLVGTDAEGLGYAQLTTIRTIGQPRYNGKLPTNIELLVDSADGENMRPDVAIRRILVQGLGVPDAKVITGVGPDGAATSSFEEWCNASPQLAVNAQMASRPGSLLEDLLRVSGGELIPTADGGVKVVPLGDQPRGDYVPASAAYVIADPAGDIVEIEKRDLTECPNQIVVRYTDPAKPEKQHQMTCRDEEDIRRTGCRPGDDVSSEWISTAAHARWLGDWMVRRALRNRKTLRFEAHPRYMAIEQGDLVSVNDAVLGDLVYRVVTKDLDPEAWRLSFEAEEWRGESEPVAVVPDVPLYDLDSDPGIPAIDTRVDAVEVAAVAAAGTNILPNGDFASWDAGATGGARPTGWSRVSNVTVSGAGANHASGSWSLFGNTDQYNTQWLNTPYVVQGAPAGNPSTYYTEDISPRIPVEVGKRYCASAYTGAHRSRMSVYIYWCDATTEISASQDDTSYNDEEKAGGPTLDGYKRCFSVGTAPAGAVAARVAIRKYDTKAGQTDSYAFRCRAQFEELKAGSTGPGPWAPPAANGLTAAHAQQLADIASDGILSPVEKPVVIRDYTVITAEQAGIDAQADAAGVSRTAYDTAVSALTTYLGTLTSPVDWDDTGGNTTIVAAEFSDAFADVYTAKQAVLDAIAGVKAQLDLSNISILGRMGLSDFGGAWAFASATAASGSWSVDALSSNVNAVSRVTSGPWYGFASALRFTLGNNYLTSGKAIVLPSVSGVNGKNLAAKFAGTQVSSGPWGNYISSFYVALVNTTTGAAVDPNTLDDVVLQALIFSPFVA